MTAPFTNRLRINYCHGETRHNVRANQPTGKE